MNTIKIILFSKLLCFFLFKISFLGISTSASGQSGSRSIALAESTVAEHGFWSIKGNPAGLARQKSLQAGINVENKFLVKELQSTDIAIAYGGKVGSLAISLNRFGFSLYSENRFGLVYARDFQKKISIGVELHYRTLTIGEEKLKTRSGDFNIGLIYQVSSKIILGFHAGNPGSLLFLGKVKSDHAPFLRLGMAYRQSKNLQIFLETYKNIDQSPLWKCGLEIIPCEKFHIRTGFSAPPLSISFGTGFKLSSLQIDIASSYHYFLGFSPCLSLQYSFSR